MLLWPITYGQARISGGLLCNIITYLAVYLVIITTQDKTIAAMETSQV